MKCKLNVLMLTSTFKFSLEAMLTWSSPHIYNIYLVHRLWWVLCTLIVEQGWCFLIALLLKAPHEDHIHHNLDWEKPNNFDTSRVLCPCCNKAIAFNLFFSRNALMGKENLHNSKRKYLRDHITNQKWEGKTLGGIVNLFLQLKVSDENICKPEPIDLSSFKI